MINLLKNAIMPLSMIMVIITVGLLTRCTKDKSERENTYIVFGYYTGWCGGGACLEMFKIENKTLFEDTSLQPPPSGRQAYEGIYTALPPTKYRIVKDLKGHIPYPLFQEPDPLIGAPNSFDQGGYYLAMSQGEILKYWHIDPFLTPNYL